MFVIPEADNDTLGIVSRSLAAVPSRSVSASVFILVRLALACSITPGTPINSTGLADYLQRLQVKLIGVPGVIEQPNAKQRRMNTDARSAETDREGTAVRLLDTIPSVSLSASGINEHFRPSATTNVPGIMLCYLTCIKTLLIAWISVT